MSALAPRVRLRFPHRRRARAIEWLRRSGRALPIKDSLIAATALVHGLTVATRNGRDFRRTGVKVVDPFA